MLKTAVIGVGNMGAHHARLYNDSDDVTLVGIADPDPDTVDAVGRRYKVPTYGDYQVMLDETRPEAVSVAVPTALHYSVSRQVIERGINVLVEKPITTTVAEATTLIDLAEERDVKLAVGHVDRFNPAVTELKNRLDSGELGRVFQVHARRLSPLPSRIMDMGVTIDLATHEIAIMRYLLDSEAERVYAEFERKAHVTEEDLLSGLIRFKNGVVGVLDVNWLTPTKIRQLTVTGERGMYLVDYLMQDVFFYENSAYATGDWENIGIFKSMMEGEVRKLRIDKKEPLKIEIESFVNAVVDDHKPEESGEQGLATLLLAQKLLESGSKKAVVELT